MPGPGAVVGLKPQLSRGQLQSGNAMGALCKESFTILTFRLSFKIVVLVSRAILAVCYREYCLSGVSVGTIYLFLLGQ